MVNNCRASYNETTNGNGKTIGTRSEKFYPQGKTIFDINQEKETVKTEVIFEKKNNLMRIVVVALIVYIIFLRK